MKFLKKEPDEEPTEKNPKNRIEIRKVYTMTVQCDDCEYWGKMNGGQLVTDEKKAAFECPECESIKVIKWMGIS